MYKESCVANYVSIGEKLTEIQNLKVEEYSKPHFVNIFEFSTSEPVISETYSFN